MPKKRKVCVWREDWDGGPYEPGCCGELFQFTEDGPIANHFKFCPYCGNPIRRPIEARRLNQQRLKAMMGRKP